MTDDNGEEAGGIGDILRKRRMLRGESVESVHQHTRIPKRFITALEESRFQDLPARIYQRGFLKSYCDHLDMEFAPLWERLLRESGDERERVPAAGAEDAAGVSARAGDAPMFLPLTETTLLPFLLFAGLIAVGAMLWVLKGRQAPAPPSARPGGGPVAGTRTRPRQAATLRVSALRECWVRVVADGSLRFEGVLPEGSPQQWTAAASFSLRTSDASALAVELGGAPLDLTALKPEPDGSYALKR